MKILYVSSALIPSGTANSINIMKSCHAMALSGHEVALLAPDINAPEIDRGCRDPFSHYGIAENFSLKKILCPNLPGGRTIYCSLATRFARQFKPDLVFGRYLRATYEISRINAPTVLELHSSIRFKGQKTRYFEKLLNRPNFLAMITLTEDMAKHFRAVDLPNIQAKPILVAGCGADPVASVPAPANLPRSANGYQIGFPGKLTKIKGLELIGELAKQTPAHDFHIFGGTTEEVAHWQNRYPLNNLHFHGFIRPGDLPPYLAALDICLLPCQQNPVNPENSIYGSPLKLFEYMAYGKAILASDYSELHEVLDASCGVFLDPQDVSAWKSAIERLTRDELNRLGQAAKRKFEQNFTRQARYDRLIENIQELIKPKA